ncbi:acetate uptake transporter [Actinotalea sp.]|uniref:acetate uptake transporter n=1 Tax=Actinotalea sp. TaxID=1872145 RepID=UPI0035663AAB
MSTHAPSAPIANPAPLGLVGFGMTTVLLNLHNAGILPMSVVIVAMGLALGGLAQIIAGLMEFRVGNAFGATAFTAYGLFWWSLVVIVVNPVESAVGAADPTSMGFYLLLWAVFTLGMFVITLRHNRITQAVFLTLTVLFALLALGDFTGSAAITTLAGWEGILCGLLALYGGLAQLVNGELGREALPLGTARRVEA